MNDPRALLIECRVALRESLAERGDLPSRLDAAIKALGEGRPPAALPPVAQVALAWQAAARALKHTQPAIYDGLNARVMEILGVRLPEGPVEELLRLERELGELRQVRARHAEEHAAELAARDADARDAQARLESLQAALAAAAPELIGDDPQALALARIDALARQAQTPRVDAAGPDRATAPAPESPIPTEAVLRQVSEGMRQFSKEQRDWVVGEALGLTGWRLTPLELLDKGDAWLARLLLEGDPETA